MPSEMTEVSAQAVNWDGQPPLIVAPLLSVGILGGKGTELRVRRLELYGLG